MRPSVEDPDLKEFLDDIQISPPSYIASGANLRTFTKNDLVGGRGVE
jgi:hypothetical protein